MAAPIMPQIWMRMMFSTMFTTAATRLVQNEWVVCWVAEYTLLRNWLKHIMRTPTISTGVYVNAVAYSGYVLESIRMLERIRTKTMSPALAININDWYASNTR